MSEPTTPCFMCGKLFFDKYLKSFDLCFEDNKKYPICKECLKNLKIKGKKPEVKA